MHSEARRLTAPLYEGIFQACQRIVGMDGSHPRVSMAPTSYVLDGRTYSLTSAGADYAFWIGINGPRLFFIAYVKDVQQEQARQAFSFCFGGAQKVGWEMNYEPLDNGVSIWASCMTDRNRPLSQAHSSTSSEPNEPNEPLRLTAEGEFWVTDIAMMVQSWVRTCERLQIRCHDMEPAPL
ncbi:MAG: hypothetical protein V4754_10540 [Pseudomonadota bacterium]